MICVENSAYSRCIHGTDLATSTSSPQICANREKKGQKTTTKRGSGAARKINRHRNPTYMAKYKLEYIWLDGYEPVANLRGKTLIKEFASFPTLEDVPNWGFDGSSTRQAEGHSSDCVLKPVGVYPDTTKENGAIVLCEVMHADGTPHSTNARATILDDPGTWFGFEQEYFLWKDGAPLGFPKDGFPAEGQGRYYCGVGYGHMGDIAREIVDTHLDLCLDAGINHEGINAEVAKGQWEFQIFGKGSRKAADEMWVARYPSSSASAKATAWT